MAARITHLEVLRQAIVLLEHGSAGQKETADRLSHEFVKYASLGAVAPDIFYFYRVLSRRRNPIGLYWGNLSHHSEVFELCVEFLRRVRDMPDSVRRSKCYAFAMGYISHCAVDIVTHPYIFYITGDYYSIDLKQAARAQENHLRVEYHLDAYLVHQRWGLDPARYHFLQYVDVREQTSDGEILDYDIWRLWVESLAAVYAEEFDSSYFGSVERILPGDVLNDSYIGFMKFNRILDTRSALVRGFLTAVDFATLHRIKARYLLLPAPHEVDARMLNEERKEWKYPADPNVKSSESFMDLVHRAAKFASEMISDADAYVTRGKKAKDLALKYAGYNLDTGLKSPSIDMHVFEPLE